MPDLKPYLIASGTPLLDAIRRLNEIIELTLFVVDEEERLIGTLTDGDIRRGLLAGKDLAGPVDACMKTGFRFVTEGGGQLERVMEARGAVVNLLPVVDEGMRLRRIINFSHHKSYLPVDAVIMAGGRGLRLSPLTDTLPKPLLKIGDKPIIDHGIDWLVRHGIEHFTVTVHYLADSIMEHLGDGSSRGVSIRYVREPRQMGTIGSLSLVRAFHNDTVLLMNSDLLTNIDLEEFYLEFIAKGADMSVACITYRVNVPYAVVDVDQETVQGLKEKPTISYQANAGIYLLKREHVGLIPPDSFFNATDLIDKLISMGRKVCHYPMLGYWLDIGKMNDFQKAQEDIKHLKF